MPAATENKTQGATVLLVDDDPHFLESMTDALALGKMKVHAAKTGREAIEALQGVTPAVVLLDAQLPDMRGLDLCRLLKQSDRLRDVPVVILSGAYTEPADRAEGLLAGADSYLSKPFRMESLWEEIQYLLAGR